MDPVPEFRPRRAVDLPHTGAMRWIREAANSTDGSTALAVARVEAGHPCVREGVLLDSALIEFMAQGAAAGVALANVDAGRRVKHGVLAAIREFEAIEVVRVAEGEAVLLEIFVARGKTFGALSEAQLEVRVLGTPVARARMTFHLQFE